MKVATLGEESTSHHGVRSFMAWSALGLGIVCLWKLKRVCTIRLQPECVTVVYDTRRKRVLRTSVDVERHHRYALQVAHYSPLLSLCNALMVGQRSSLVVPRTSFFGVFTMPHSVFDAPGNAVSCSVEQLHVSDGVLNIVLTLRYTICFEQLERYLAAVGPQPPNELLAIAAASVARSRSTEVSVGILLSKQRREAVFMEAYTYRLASKLLSEAAIQLQGVVVENVELIDP